MKIIQLTTENIKRIKAIEIKPKGNMVVISGKNDQGKTSVLDSIWFALTGKDSLKETPKPIREGEKTAKVTLDLEDFIVTRNWTENDTYLKVENKEGERVKSPQELLDKFVGRLSFDPLEFSRLDQREQRELLLDFVGLRTNLERLDNEKKEIYDERTIKGRELKSAMAQLEAIEEPSSNIPEEEVNIAELTKKLESGITSNAEIEAEKREMKIAEENIKKKEIEIKRLQEEIEDTEVFIEQAEKRIEKSKYTDIQTIQKELNQAEQTNREVREAKQRQEYEETVIIIKVEYEKMTERLKEIEETKREELRKAAMPIEGLGIDEDGVTYGSIPFSQLGSAAQLKISMAIAMAINPKLRVIRITDGSLLDKKNMEIIEKMAKKTDFQVWIEKVDDSGKIGFYIEEGKVIKAN